MSWYTELIGCEHLSIEQVGTEQRADIHKLTTFLDLALEVVFLEQKILKMEVGLVHVLSGIGSNLFVGAGGPLARSGHLTFGNFGAHARVASAIGIARSPPRPKPRPCAAALASRSMLYCKKKKSMLL